MKKIGIISALVLLFSFFLTTANAQDYKLAAGIRFSSKSATINNSISLKYFFNTNTAVEALLSFGDPLALGLLVEKHKPLISTNFTWLYGGGAYVGFAGNNKVGLQGIIGLDYKISSIPIDLSLDWKPELNLASKLSFEPAALGVSARFTFK